MNLLSEEKSNGIAVCSLGDACCTEGEVSEALQMAVLKQLPILYLVQDNEWDISAHASEIRAQDMSQFAQGFNGLEVFTIDGTDFVESFTTLQKVVKIIREEQRPVLVRQSTFVKSSYFGGS